MRFYLQALSPVHIGSGKEIEPFEYVVKNGRYHRINIDSAMRKLYETENWNEYEAWLNDIEEKLERASDNREQSRIRRDINVVEFCTKKLKQPQLAEELLNSHSLYHAACPSQVSFRVREATKAPDSEVVIPGSSIKGAIRTALVYAVLNEHPELWGQAYRIIMDKVRKRTKAGEELENLIMCCGERKKGPDGRFRTKFGDAKFDLMKIIRVSDTFMPSAGIGVSKSAVFSVDRNSGRVKKVMDLPVEVIVPQSVFQLEIDIDREFLLNASSYETDKGWIGLKDKMKRVFDLDVAKINKQNVDDYANVALERLKLTCCRFSSDMLKNDGVWLQKIPEDKSRRIKEFQNSLAGNGWIVRLGWGSGWTGTTVGLFLKAENLGQDFNELNRKFKIARGRTNIQNFPLSRRFVYEHDMPTMPLGWVSLTTEPVESKLPAEKNNKVQQPETPVETKPPEEEKKPIDRLTSSLKVIQPEDAGRIGSVINDALAQLDTDEEKKTFARAVKEHMGKAFRKSKARMKLEEFLE